MPAPAALAVEQVFGLSVPASDVLGLLPLEPPHPSAPIPSAIVTTAARARAKGAARFTEELASTPRTWGGGGYWQACRREGPRSNTGRSVQH
jgi:hypothetical protein